MIKKIQHEVSVETLVMAYDHQPYSSNTAGIPVEVADAVRTGFGFNIFDLDCRQMEWDGHV